MPETRTLSPAAVQSLITRFRQGLINPDNFIRGLANQDMVLDSASAQTLLREGVLTPDQFELITGRNTQLLAGSQGFFDRAQNFLEGTAQDAGFVGEAGVSRGEQAFRAGTFLASLTPAFGVGARAVGGSRALLAAQGASPEAATAINILRSLSGGASRVLGQRFTLPFTRGREANVAAVLSSLGSFGTGVVSPILEGDEEFSAQVAQREQGVNVGQGTSATEQGERQVTLQQLLDAFQNGELPEAELVRLLTEGNYSEDEVAQALLALGERRGETTTTTPDGFAEDEAPFEFVDVPDVGRFVRFREEIIDPETGDVLGTRLGAPILVDDGTTPGLDANTILAVSQQLADPASALSLQAGFARLLSQADPESLDPTTRQLADLLGIRPGQTTVDVSRLPSDVTALFGIQGGEAPIPGISRTVPTGTSRDITVQEGGGIESQVSVPQTRRETTQGLDLQRIPNLNALSQGELAALNALATVQGIDLNQLAEQSELVTPPGGTRRRTTVSR